ncbi:MAG TPA: RagB/SusD family nutrient uptake outer membrane protein [Gemmatimonadaceae bacterium]|nr:RagB/SusD family nutrient uptake outer membrane protein [Gemmatimonadaceae bacterium]
MHTKTHSITSLTEKSMKRLGIALALAAVAVTASCKDFLDVNTNPNAPQAVGANLYLSPMEHWMVTAPEFDGRFVGRYTQQWFLANGQTAISTWDRMGYDPSSDNGAEQWRDVYWSLGQNLVDMINKAEAEQRWDIAGAGYFMKAWGWLVLTDLHGDIIIKEAMDPTRSTFDYDTQEYAYSEVARLIDLSIKDLQRTDGAVDPIYFGKTDHLFNGDRTRWLKMAYGLKAISLNHFSNKASYSPKDVIAAVDQSFQSNAEEAVYQYPCQDPAFADCNFLGTHRGNVNSYRQTQFVVKLMDGTDFGAVDPRMSRMLAPSSDGRFRGVDPTVAGYGAIPTAQQPFNFFGYAGTAGSGLSSRYIFDDKNKFPFMTYAQLQFVKAEAAYRMGDKATALTAYRNGISAHIDFVNARNAEISSQSATPISSAEKAAFLGDTRIVPTDPNKLTLTLIMSQKYIAQWAWGHNELWMDMRRYHYTDIDPASGTQVFPGFTPPNTTILYPDNAGKVAQRIRPRFNSEYIWNVPGLSKIGALALDYHTTPLWITQP